MSVRASEQFSSMFAKVEAALLKSREAIDEALQSLGVQPVIAPVTAPAIVKPGYTLLVSQAWPDKFPGEESPELLTAIKQAASICGLFWQVLEAIQRWETGHYKDPNANAWLHAWNPGGMKWNGPNSSQLGALEMPYQVREGSTKWQAWGKWYLGILGHGKFLAHSNYNAARAATTVESQIDAIAAAGYADHDGAWTVNVKRIAKSLPPISTTNPPAVVLASDELVRARSAIGKGVVYRQSIEGVIKGDDPALPLPGYYHADGSVTCDCSEYGAWVKGYKRANKWNTQGIKQDAQTSRICFSIVQKGAAVVGDQLNYYDEARKLGHHGYVSAVRDGVPVKCIHCHGGQEPAIQETDCEIFWIHGADIVRYHGPREG